LENWVREGLAALKPYFDEGEAGQGCRKEFPNSDRKGRKWKRGKNGEGKPLSFTAQNLNLVETNLGGGGPS